MELPGAGSSRYPGQEISSLRMGGSGYNYLLSVNRLQGMLRHLRQDIALLREYDQDQLTNPIHYLPHHKKVPVVYDASANGLFLNDSLLKGQPAHLRSFGLIQVVPDCPYS